MKFSDFEFFSRNNNLTSNNLAIISFERNITYSDLNNLVNQTAATLSEKYKIIEGTHIGILSDNNPDFIVLLLALWKLNAVPIPLNIRLLDTELLRLIEHSESIFVFVHKNFQDRLIDFPNKFIFPVEILDKDIEINTKNSDDNSPALIMYTSGSTGMPKGVSLTHSNLLSSAEFTVDFVNQTSNDKWLASLPFYHIGGLQVIIRAILKCSSIIISKSLNIESIIETLVEHKPTLASFVTTTLRRIVELQIEPNPEMRFLFLGGGPIDTGLINKASELGWNIIKTYGSTETSSMITALNCRALPAKIDTTGKAFKNCYIKIVDELGKELPCFSKGEITVSGKNVMTGYWNNVFETNNKIRNKYYFTGDIGYLDNEGYLFIEARRTDLIVSGGENINPLEVETELLKLPEIKDVCVFPVTDIEWGQIAAVAIVSNNDSELTDIIIKESLKEKIASYKIPKKYYFVESLPRNELGKINREEIRKRFE